MDKPKGKYYTDTVPQTGLTVLFDPPKPTLDIVFVHGFTGHPERTWACKREATGPEANDEAANEPFKSPRKTLSFSAVSRSFSSHKGAKSHVYWPRDLVPLALPNARVLTFGYDSRVRHKLASDVDRSTVCEFAWELLLSLEADRRLDASRPIAFVAHSLGGIVVKELLRRSKSCQPGQAHLQRVFNSTTGIVFFGTPHAGADPRAFLHRAVEKVIRVAQFTIEEQIVQTLLPTSERLKELRDVFGPMAQERSWIIHSFQEKFGVKLLNDRKVVEDTSSCLGLSSVETIQYIRQNHMEMCRFTGLDDQEYKKVVSALQRIAASACQSMAEEASSIFSDNFSLIDDEKRTLMDSLRFDQIDARQLTIKNAHLDTCKWLLETSEYVGWLDPDRFTEHHGFLWIKGKAGTGKSTLMKFILSNAWKEMTEEVVVSFFFNARGGDLEKSTIGMYRSLLFQILEKIPELQNLPGQLPPGPLYSSMRRGTRFDWGVEALKAFFEEVIRNLGNSSLVCFIDALDECEEYEIRDMVSFFEHLGRSHSQARKSFRVCFASRHYPQITICKGLDLVLEAQGGHSADIVNYLNSELKVGENKLAQDIRHQVQEKASGVFMWVVLVTRILNREYDCGNIHSLRQRLRDIPKDLHTLFREILTHDNYNRDQLLLCVQWILFAEQPLTPEELYFAVLSGVRENTISKWDRDEITESDMTRFIINSSKGLAEITKSSRPTVQFIHESVRDFLLKEGGLREIWPALTDNLEGQVHEQLKQCCFSTMQNAVAQLRNDHIEESIPPLAEGDEAAKEGLRELPGDFPFLSYAVSHIISHSDEAEGTGISQAAFLQSFQVSKWIMLDNMFQERRRPGKRCRTKNASLLYVLAELDAANLIRHHPSKLDCFKKEDEYFGVPYLAAVAKGNAMAARTFLEAQLEVAPLTPSTRMLCERFLQHGGEDESVGEDYEYIAWDPCVSLNLAWHAPEPLVMIYDHSEEFTIDMKAHDPDGQRHLSAAICRRHEAVVRFLLQKGVSVHGTDKTHQPQDHNALLRASRYGHESLVKLFIEHGADIESADSDNGTALVYAAASGNEKMVRVLLDAGARFPRERSFLPSLKDRGSVQRVITIAKLLLENGADVDATNAVGQTALEEAVGEGNEPLVEFLINEGAKIDAKAHTPLLTTAIAGGDVKITRLLVENGANIEAREPYAGQTPLSVAALYGYEDVVRMLVENGANIEARQTLTDRTPLGVAVSEGRYGVAKLLLEKGAKINARDKLGETPLATAMVMAQKGKVTVPVPDVRGTGTFGFHTMRDAEDRHYEDIAALLIAEGADIHAEDYQGRTPLMIAEEEPDSRLAALVFGREGLIAEAEDCAASSGSSVLSRATAAPGSPRF
ncbi:hypothetical protein B0T16DRAFT_176251 [Cercophora newfieldiana]|uniref:Nephrocystin 3-like N-terminal domain-containing protein n=1 Tax=Cercophora newfieldiana TaxID=92897 RepID=A0AA39XZE1_9PEZI|nr:hypothetical protein B0T16DRAFT_176251 [Cercophora newfieldiana]